MAGESVKRSLSLLRMRQSLPLEAKVDMTQRRIRQWHAGHSGMTYVAYSGGKDSEVLLHLVREIYPDTPAVFVNTGLEWPEITRHVRDHDNVTFLKPDMGFREVISRYGYPVVSKKVSRFISDLRRPADSNAATQNLRLTGRNRDGVLCPSMKLAKKWHRLVESPFKISSKCCDVMKKRPLHKYSKLTGRVPYTGEMASDSQLRERAYLMSGCNAFSSRSPKSMPIGFWTGQDVLQYVKSRNLDLSPVYGDLRESCDGRLFLSGEQHTGCTFCLFGLQFDAEPNRIQRMSISHPKLWRYCMDILGLREVMEFLGYPCEIPYTDAVSVP